MFRFLVLFFIFGISYFSAQTKVFKGKAGKRTVTLILNKSTFDKKNPNYQGYFYFDDQQQPIFLNQTSSEKSDLNLENKDHKPSISMKGKLGKQNYKGILKENNSTYSFNLSIDENYIFKDYNFFEDYKVKLNKGTVTLLNFYSSVSIVPNVAEQQAILQSIYKKGSITSLEQYQQKVYKDIVTNFGFDSPSIKKQIDDQFPTTEVNIDIFPFIVEKNYMVYDTYFFQYTGQGHAIYGVSYINYDTLHQKVINNESFFHPDSHLNIEILLNRKVRKELDLAPDSSLEEADIKDNCFIVHSLPFTYNFYINRYGVTFVYNVYEVSTFECGPYEISLDWNEIKDYTDFEYKD